MTRYLLALPFALLLALFSGAQNAMARPVAEGIGMLDHATVACYRGMSDYLGDEAHAEYQRGTGRLLSQARGPLVKKGQFYQQKTYGLKKPIFALVVPPADDIFNYRIYVIGSKPRLYQVASLRGGVRIPLGFKTSSCWQISDATDKIDECDNEWLALIVTQSLELKKILVELAASPRPPSSRPASIAHRPFDPNAPDFNRLVVADLSQHLAGWVEKENLRVPGPGSLKGQRQIELQVDFDNLLNYYLPTCKNLKGLEEAAQKLEKKVREEQANRLQMAPPSADRTNQ